MNPRFWAFDLEMNKPSGKIIQIGAVVGRVDTGKILDVLNIYVNPHEQLDPFIIELCGISQDTVDHGIELADAGAQLEAWVTENKACKSPIVWGNGDLRCLKQQSGAFQDVHREIDLKTIHQFNTIKRGISMKGGLAKAIESYGGIFEGRQHDAQDDAINTFNLAHILYERL